MVGTFSLVDNWNLKLYELGLEPADILNHAHLSPDLFTQKEAKVSEEEYFRLFDAMDALLPNVPLGLEYVNNVPIEAYSLPILLALSSENLNVALGHIVNFRKIICPVSIKVHTSSEETIISLDRIGNGSLPVSVGMVMLLFFIHIARTATRSEINPLWVSVIETPHLQAKYEDDLGIRFKRGQKYAVSFSAVDATKPFLTVNSNKVDLFLPSLEQKLANIEDSESAVARVQEIIREYLTDGPLSINDVSVKLGISVRSLQRQLASEKTTFKQVLTATRKEMACYFLSNTEKTVGDIAMLVGFEDANSFFRVFKTWTGETPGNYRETHPPSV